MEGEDALADLEAALKGRATEEQKAELIRQHREALRKRRGVTMTKGGGVKREDWEKFKAQRLAKKG